MTDEVERCMAAGMNAVLAKPLEIGKLRELLELHGLRLEGTAAPATPAPQPPAAAPIDLGQLRRVVGDDAEFLRELCETFIASSTAIVSELAQALAAQDRSALSSLAHKLKGGSSSVCAQELAKLAAALEKEAKEKPMSELEASISTLERAFEAARNYVAAQVPA
jgi:two-component system, sensor histidine kinase and response regulator